MEAEATLRVGIIGCGVIAPTHVESYRGLDGVTVAALCDLVPEKARRLAERCDEPKPEIFEDYRCLLRSGKVDAISVCTDHASHEEISLAALGAGISILCEKALSTDRASLDRMGAAAAGSTAVAAGVFQHRFDPVYQRLRDFLKAGRLGRIVNANLSHQSHRSHAYYRGDEWRGTWWGEGGSLLLNQTIHFIDLLQWMLDGAEEVRGLHANLGHEGVIETEDTAALALRFGNGALGAVSASSASHLTWHVRLEIVGTEGLLAFEDGELRECRFNDDALAEKARGLFAGEPEAASSPSGRAYYGSSHPAQIRDFVRAVRAGTPPRVSFAEARKAVDIVLSAYGK
ncbi:MAG: Gfo/Idh/MocA family oxidoreductase [Verrucomicrobia bacterium]|nr:Gfo/Idh/MocA family oxidoreductase [Verrucomicrobiota bacterium]